MTLAELEASAQVPLEQQTTTQAEAPPEPPLSTVEQDRQRLLGVVGNGRLRPR